MTSKHASPPREVYEPTGEEYEQRKAEARAKTKSHTAKRRFKERDEPWEVPVIQASVFRFAAMD
jgi:hypothetical protein